MIVKLGDETLINMDKVTTIFVSEEDHEYALTVAFEIGNQLTLYYDTEKEALNDLNKVYQHFI